MMFTASRPPWIQAVAPRRFRPDLSWLLLLLLFTPASSLARDPAVIGEPEDPAGGGGDPARGRILAQVNEREAPPGRLERLAAAIPPEDVVRGLERAIDPRVLKLFGGPGLDVDALRSAVNYDLRRGGRPHMMLAAGLAGHAALTVIERVRLPGCRLGATGPGYGLSSRLPEVAGGVYLAPAATAGAGLTRGVNFKVKRLPVPKGWSRATAGMELQVAAEERPDPLRPVAARSVRLVVPLCRSRLQTSVGASVAVVRIGPSRTLITGVAPAFTTGRLHVAAELRRADSGTTAYFDFALRAAWAPVELSLRLRQDPARASGAAVDLRVQVADLVPLLGL